MGWFKKSDPDQTSGNPENWERSVLEKVAMASVVEQRRARRWGVFFKLAFLLYLLTLTSLTMFANQSGGRMSSNIGPHTAVVDVTGVIMAGAEADAERLVKGLKNAADDINTKGIILRMNTPGGSPVQSSYVYQAIVDLKTENPDLPVYAVVEDICASGGYYIAAATDAIYVNPSSIVGSIGVVMNGFGFVDTLKTLGVERRLLTAGEHKGFLDPFSPVNPQEKQHVQKLLNQIHTEFIQSVKAGRGDRLQEHPDLFSGLVWAGAESIQLGLADDLGNVASVAKDVIGAENIVDFTVQEHFFDRLAKGVGKAMANAMAQIMGTGTSYSFSQ